MEVTFDFEAERWEWHARNEASWVFVTLPVEVADEIRDIGRSQREFGSVRPSQALAIIVSTTTTPMAVRGRQGC